MVLSPLLLLLILSTAVFIQFFFKEAVLKCKRLATNCCKSIKYRCSSNKGGSTRPDGSNIPLLNFSDHDATSGSIADGDEEMQLAPRRSESDRWMLFVLASPPLVNFPLKLIYDCVDVDTKKSVQLDQLRDRIREGINTDLPIDIEYCDAASTVWSVIDSEEQLDTVPVNSKAVVHIVGRDPLKAAASSVIADEKDFEALELPWHENLRSAQNRVIQLILVYLMVGYIALVSTALEPLSCKKDLNGKWYMKSNPSTVCNVSLFTFPCSATVVSRS